MPLYAMGLAILVLFPPRPSNFLWAGPPLALGLALRSWSAGHLVKNEALTMTGPYAHLRHPLYAGTMLLALGFGVLLGNGPGLLMVCLSWVWLAFRYFPRKERVEADRLEALYGQQYLAYRQAVPALWPRWVEWKPSLGEATEKPSWSVERYSDNNELGTLIAVLGGLLVFWLRTRWVAG
jgi:hypothetical protein